MFLILYYYTLLLLTSITYNILLYVKFLIDKNHSPAQTWLIDGAAINLIKCLYNVSNFVCKK